MVAILTVKNYKSPELITDVTLSPEDIMFIEAGATLMGNLELKKVIVYFINGAVTHFNVNATDLYQIQQAIGSYELP